MDVNSMLNPSTAGMVQNGPLDLPLGAAQAKNPIRPQEPKGPPSTKFTVEKVLADLAHLRANPPTTSIFDLEVTNKTHQRRQRMLHIATEAIRNGATPSELIQCMHAQNMALSTKCSYAQTMQAEMPELRRDRMWNRGLSALQALAAVDPRKRATPVVAARLGTFVSSNSLVMSYAKTTLLVMWVTASRLADLSHMKTKAILPIAPGYVAFLVSMVGSKGDRLGKKGHAKAFVVPQSWAARVRQILEDFNNAKSNLAPLPPRELTKVKIPHANTIVAQLKKISPYLGIRSIRRGASQFLKAQGVSREQVAMQTLHGQKKYAAATSLDGYTDGQWWVESREKKQLKNSLILLQGLNMMTGCARIIIHSKLKRVRHYRSADIIIPTVIDGTFHQMSSGEPLML